MGISEKVENSMIENLPGWVSNAKIKLDKTIEDLCVENGINWTFVADSKGISDCKDEIIVRLINISISSKPSINQPIQNLPTMPIPKNVFKAQSTQSTQSTQLTQSKPKGRPKGSYNKNRKRFTYTPEMKDFLIEGYKQRISIRDVAEQMNNSFPELKGTMTSERVRQANYLIKRRIGS